MTSEEAIIQLKSDKVLRNFIFNEPIDFGNLSNYNFELSRCTFKEESELQKFEGSIRFIECTIHKDLNINSRSGFISFENCSINEISCSNENQLSGFEIRENDNKKRDQIKRLNLRKVNKTELSNIQIKNFLVNEGSLCTVSNCKIEQFESNNINVRLINKSDIINCKIVRSNNLSVENCNFTDLILKGKTTTLFLDVVNIQNLTLQHLSLSEPERTQIKRTTVSNTINFLTASIDPLEFYNCNFSSMRMKVSDTNLYQTTFDTVLWPQNPFIDMDSVQSQGDSKQKRRQFRINENNRIQNIYRHLKQSAESVNDKINHQKFKAYELDKYMRTQRCNWSEITNKIPLWIGRYTNFFGLKWVLPIGWYIGFSLLIFIIISACYILSDQGGIDKQLTADFARFLNPTHNIDNLKSIESEQAGIIILDYVGRISQGFFGYQTIKGFRKPYF